HRFYKLVDRVAISPWRRSRKSCAYLSRMRFSALLDSRRRRLFFRMSRLAKRHIDRMSAIEERHSRPSTHTELAAHFHERIMIGHHLQSRFSRLDRFLAIAGGDVDAREIRV